MRLAGFARGLIAAGVEIFSTGGTRKHLESEGVPVRDIAEYTGFPEMMDGRLKTLHPKVHGGILCRHDTPQSPEILEQIVAHGCTTFELRRRLAAEAFAHTANYDRAIADFFAGETT